MTNTNFESAENRPPRILIAGIGNIFLGDDAFGVEVAQRLLNRPMPKTVQVVDFGIRSFDLAYALLDSYDVAILVDAAPRGSAPGTLYVIQPDQQSLTVESGIGETIDTHGMDPVKVMRLASTLGGKMARVLVVGCEPSPMTAEQDMAMGLSAAVESAIEPAVALLESLVAKILRGTFPVMELTSAEIGV